MRLHAQALQIDRPTSLPDWWGNFPTIHSLDAEASIVQLQTQRLFLKGCQDLMDGDYAAAIDDLSQTAADWGLLSAPLQRAVPSAMVAACLGAKDYTETEIWGYRALEQYHKDHPQDGTIADLLARIECLEVARSQLITSARRKTTDSPAASVLLEHAIQVCNAVAGLESCEPLANAVEAGVQQSYVEARKRRDAQILVLECDHMRQRAIGTAETVPSGNLEPLLFAAQVLAGDSLDLLQRNSATVAEGEEIRDRMHRFAAFALKANRPDLMRRAMDVAASEPTTTDGGKRSPRN